MDVIVIPGSNDPRKKIKEKRKTRVAAYCRVSTLLEEQESSYLSQISFYTDYITGHRGWTLAGIYADEGLSGTGTRNRIEFNRMIEDCLQGRIDLIVTKSISRFARNTLDCLKYIRLLKERGIAVYFEKEAINTLDAKGEVLITIMASLAQQESLSISQNVKMGIRYQFAQGKLRINCSRFLGYEKDEEGRLVIVPEEAATIRRIYEDYLNGKTPARIARELTQEQIPTGSGKTKWYDSAVRFILSNEKYMGDALLQKGYVVDYLTKKRAVNRGDLPQYYVENSHPAIISNEMFLAVQQKLYGQILPKGQQRQAPQGGKYPFSGKIYCSYCGNTYRRVKANGLNKYTTWRCKTRMKSSLDCKGRIIKEDDLFRIMEQAVNMVSCQSVSGLPPAETEAGAAITIRCTEDLIRRVLERITISQEKAEVLLKDGTRVECG